ncbi:hypothetical protein [Rummeliibacillus stabekisii]|uniref:Uncharacterized protein n=1 Tax=Rummeliibacillus stabekisii TaxID=241244 RepID=A0A143HBR2_9BACL|nr:hypothetical protein [Rummeliibacillus stabekisii]AMW99197.1 hypothetical protein ATY39_06805 [Rummeliibacillus stabekisii]
MDKFELLKRLSEITGDSLLIQFYDKNAADLTYQSAEKLRDEGKINLGELTRRNDFSVHIQANIK